MRGSAPKPPDPAETAAAQSDQNFGTALLQQSLNTMNQQTPYGALRYNQTGVTEIMDPATGEMRQVPQYTATQTLNDMGQRILNQSQKSELNLARLANQQSRQLGRILGAGSVESPELRQSYSTDFSEDRQRVEDALMSRLNPQIERDRESLRTSLANQGFREGSEGFDRAMSRFGEKTNDARMQAILAGGQEQSRMVALEADRANFENAATAGQYQLDTAASNDPINRITALMSGSQVTNPSFVPTPQTNLANVDRAGLDMAAYQGNLQRYNSQQQGLGAIFGAGATLLGAPSGSIMGGLFG